MSGSSPFTPQERARAFLTATSGFAKRYAEKIADGMSDCELECALAASLGSFGGSSGPDQLHITFKGSGLKIWASHEVHNHVTAKPILEGVATIRMAREVYAISDPTDMQLPLL